MFSPNFHRRSRRLSGFLEARGGNVAMIAGLLLLPMLLGVGVGVDFARKAEIKSAVQEAADAAILRVARMKSLSPMLSDNELTERAREIFETAFKRGGELDITTFRVAYDAKSGGFALEIDAAMPTTLLGVAGVKSLDLDTASSVKLGKPPYLEVALVLDNTGSMNSGGRLEAAKSAAADLASAVLSFEENKSKVAVVPFSQYVNVGANGKGKYWMKDSGRSKRQNGATDEPDVSAGETPAADGSVSKADLAAEPKLNSWNGCVGSRPFPANTEKTDFVGKPVPEVYNGVCPNEIVPLTTNKGLVLAKIKTLKAQGNTYIAGGLEWGWHALTNESPFREGVTIEELRRRGGVKNLVVLTDGENTRAPNYPTHDSSNRTLANQLTARLCDEIKKDEIVIYAIAFGVDDAATHALLEKCASSPQHYFAASSSGELSSAFETIAGSMRQLILTK